MNEELFPAEAVTMESPRLAWLRKHGLETEHLHSHAEDPECPETGDTIPKWVCRAVKLHPNFSLYCPSEIGSGDTEDEACADLAMNAGMKLWNEETL